MMDDESFRLNLKLQMKERAPKQDKRKNQIEKERIKSRKEGFELNEMKIVHHNFQLDEKNGEKEDKVYWIQKELNLLGSEKERTKYCNVIWDKKKKGEIRKHRRASSFCHKEKKTEFSFLERSGLIVETFCHTYQNPSEEVLGSSNQTENTLRVENKWEKSFRATDDLSSQPNGSVDANQSDSLIISEKENQSAFFVDSDGHSSLSPYHVSLVSEESSLGTSSASSPLLFDHSPSFSSGSDAIQTIASSIRVGSTLRIDATPHRNSSSFSHTCPSSPHSLLLSPDTVSHFTGSGDLPADEQLSLPQIAPSRSLKIDLESECVDFSVQEKKTSREKQIVPTENEAVPIEQLSSPPPLPRPHPFFDPLYTRDSTHFLFHSTKDISLQMANEVQDPVLSNWNENFQECLQLLHQVPFFLFFGMVLLFELNLLFDFYFWFLRDSNCFFQVNEKDSGPKDKMIANVRLMQLNEDFCHVSHSIGKIIISEVFFLKCWLHWVSIPLSFNAFELSNCFEQHAHLHFELSTPPETGISAIQSEDDPAQVNGRNCRGNEVHRAQHSFQVRSGRVRFVRGVDLRFFQGFFSLNFFFWSRRIGFVYYSMGALFTISCRSTGGQPGAERTHVFLQSRIARGVRSSHVSCQLSRISTAGHLPSSH